jgi:hypothetical protein
MSKLLILTVVILIGTLLFYVGNVVIGKNNRGGKRLVVLVAGLIMAGIGALFVRVIYDGDFTQWYPWVFLVFGLCAGFAGMSFIYIALLGKNKTLDEAFRRVLGI